MNGSMLFLISGIFFLIFLAAALELSRLIRKKSGTWEELNSKADNETSPLMEMTQEIPDTDATSESGSPTDAEGNLIKLELPKAPEIMDTIITHTDWDGIISGALIKHLSPLARIIVSTPRKLRVDLRAMARSTDKPNRLFVTDLGIGSEYLPDIESALIDLSQAGTKVYWYDHHPWSPLSIDTVRQDCADLIVDTNYRNAAEIVFERIMPEDEHSQRLIRLLKNSSVPKDEEWSESWKHLIMATQASGTFSEIEELINNLASNRSFSMTDRFRISRMVEEEKIYKQFAEKPHREETTKGGLRFLIVDLRTFRVEADQGGKLHRKFSRHTPPASIGYDIVQYHNPDFYIMVLKNDRLSIRGGTGNKFRVDTLSDLRKINGKPIQIAGHTYAAGVYLTVGFSSKLKYIWDWSLPIEVEEFIGELKDRL